MRKIGCPVTLVTTPPPPPIYAEWHPRAANILNKVTLKRVMLMTFTLTHSVQYNVCVVTQHWGTSKSQGVRGSIEENRITAHWDKWSSNSLIGTLLEKLPKRHLCSHVSMLSHHYNLCSHVSMLSHHYNFCSHVSMLSHHYNLCSHVSMLSHHYNLCSHVSMLSNNHNFSAPACDHFS